MITHSAIRYDFERKYRFKLRETAVFYLDERFKPVPNRMIFSDSQGNEWLDIEGRTYRVKAGYAWNGCSPRPLGKYGCWWLGTPDFPASIMASLAHDAGYQFLDDAGFPYSRGDIDRLFLGVMQAGGFPLARVYWGAVRVFGGIDRMITR
jgi:hypothetical protein